MNADQTDRCIARLIAPATSTKVPVLTDATLSPPAVIGVLARAWLHNPLPARQITVHHLANVTILANGLLFDAEGALFPENADEYSDDDIAHGHESAAQTAEVPILQRTCIMCKSFGPDRELAWLLEMLPAAWLARRGLPDGAPDFSDAVFILDDATEPLRQRMIDGLQLLGPPAPVATFIPPMAMRVAELVVVRGLTAPCSLGVQALLDITAEIPVGPPQLLFFSRTDAGTCRMRDSEDGDAVADAAGFTVIHPQRRNFREMVALCKGALGIVGIAGPDIAFALFARPRTPIFVLAPASGTDTVLWALAQMRQQPYSEIRCAQHEDQPELAPAARDLIMEAGALDVLLRRVFDATIR